MQTDDEGLAVLSEEEVREYARHILLQPTEVDTPSWDFIAEGHPSGLHLTSETCYEVREALQSASVAVSWPPAAVLQVEGVLDFESLDDGGEALLASVSDGSEEPGVWVRLISNLGDEKASAIEDAEGRAIVVNDHALLHSLIGRRVRVTVEQMD